MTALFCICSTELSCFLTQLQKRFAVLSVFGHLHYFKIKNNPLLNILFVLIFILSPSTMYTGRCFPPSQSRVVRVHFLDALPSSLAIHKFQSISPRSLPIFNILQSRRPECHSFILSFFKSFKYDSLPQEL